MRSGANEMADIGKVLRRAVQMNFWHTFTYSPACKPLHSSVQNVSLQSQMWASWCIIQFNFKPPSDVRSDKKD
jgi:hypothetical protein